MPSKKRTSTGKYLPYALTALLSLAPLAAMAQSLDADSDNADNVQANAIGNSNAGIGNWDGVTPSLALSTPYENPVACKVDFGMISYYNHPWRGYMDTWNASQYNNSLGAYWSVADKYADAVAQMYQEAGIKYVRREIGWSNIGFDDQLTPTAKAALLVECAAWKAHGIRPLILLNANDGIPCPTRSVPVTIVTAAPVGATTVKLSGTLKNIRPGYTGFYDGRSGFPFITAVDSEGTAHLSAPLSYAVAAGTYQLQDLKYQPFQANVPAHSLACLAAQSETYAGWMKYVAAVAAVVKQGMGGTATDAGFDVEVWNELTFGSTFLDINNYYNGSLGYGKSYTYSHTRSAAGLVPGAPTTFTATGSHAILPMTCDFFSNASNGYQGVSVISGFSNQEPYDSGYSLWPGQTGFSRHYYTGGWSDISPAAPFANSGNTATTDFYGNHTGTTPNNSASIVAGSGFIPTFREAFPEFWESGLKTENLIRDLQPDSRTGHGEYGPLTGIVGGLTLNHGRYTHNGDLHPALTVETETNWWRTPFMAAVAADAGVSTYSAAMEPLDEWMEAKLGLRQFVFHASKGLDRTYLFNGGVDPEGFGMLPSATLKTLDASGDVDTTAVEATKPAILTALDWVHTLMSGGQALAAPRPLTVSSVVEYKPRLVFKGANATNLPDVTNKDLFAFLPYQLSANQFAIPYYVATMDVTHVWDSTKSPLDHTRYDMPQQQFDVTIGNVYGPQASVSAFDPLTQTSVPVSVVSSTATTLTVRLEAVDYPRFLQLTEAHVGPTILSPLATATASGGTVVSFKTNMPVSGVLTYGGSWTNRQTSTLPLTSSSNNSYSFTLPKSTSGMTAVRIIAVDADGVATEWPRFDEDPQGQVILPGTAISPNVKH